LAAEHRITLRRRLPVQAEVAYQLVVEIEKFPEFMENVIAVRLLEFGPDRKVAAWETLIDGAPLDWTEEGLYDPARLRVDFRALDGVFDRFDGYWQVTADDDGCEVDLQLDYVVGLDEIEDIIGPILQERLSANLASMLDGLETRALAP
jgi:coenzyme Q-binding protein COQ10